MGLSDLAESAQAEEDPSRNINQYKAPDARLFPPAPVQRVLNEAKLVEEKRKRAYMSASKQLADAFDAISSEGVECLKNQSTDKMHGKLQCRPQSPDFDYESSDDGWQRLTTGNLDRRVASEQNKDVRPSLIVIKEKVEAYNALFDQFQSSVCGVNHDRDVEHYVQERRRSRAEEDAQEALNRARGVDGAIVNAASIVMNGYSAGTYSNGKRF